MLVENQLVDVRVGVKTLHHFNELGYNVKVFDIISVPPEHLTNGSNIKVAVICDQCGKVMNRAYNVYLKYHVDGLDYCKDCCSIKTRNTCVEKYGGPAPMSSEEIKQKTMKTNLERYGVLHPIQNPEIEKKMQQTIMDRYGVSHASSSDEIKNKVKNTLLDKYGVEGTLSIPKAKEKFIHTCMEKYGVENPSQAFQVKEKKKQTAIEHYGCDCTLKSQEVREKIKQTNLEKYGVSCVLENPEVRTKAEQTILKKYGVKNVSHSKEIQEKIRQSFYLNGTVKTSSQQLAVFDMVFKKYPDVKLNFPYSSCSLDVYMETEGTKIDIEYDCSYWHKDKMKDLRRDKFLQSNGFKTLRIKAKELLPTEEELFSAIDYLVNTEHHFKEIILSDWNENTNKEGE